MLDRAEPAVNSQLREPPTQLTLFFSEAIEQRFTGARVTDQDGKRVDDRVEFDAADDTVLRVFLKPVSPGYLIVNWENVSAVDGHRISGSYALTILNPDGSQPPGAAPMIGASTSGEEPKPLRVFTKWLLLLAGCALTGAFAFSLYVTPGLPGESGQELRDFMDKRVRVLAAGALLVLALGGVVELFLQASNVGVGVGDVLDTRWGERWELRNAFLGIPLVALTASVLLSQSHRRPQAALGIAGAAVYMAITSSVSHGAAGGGAFWAVSSDFVHLLAASVWIGMLALLVVLFLRAKHMAGGEKYPVLAEALRRFSNVAVFSVALLLFTGVVNSVIELQRFSDLLDSGYGRALGVKLILLLPLLSFGGINAYLLRPSLIEAVEATANIRNRQAMLLGLEARLGRLVRWELGTAIAVLLVVGLLVQISPTRGRLDSAAQAGKFTESQTADGITATLIIDPNQPGLNSFEVDVSGDVTTIDLVRLRFTKPGTNEAVLSLEPSKPPSLYYVGEGPFISEPGKWRVAVDIRRTTGNDLLLPFDTKVAGSAVSSTGGSSDFDSPVSFTAVSVALVVLTGVLMVGMVAGSYFPRDLVGGYLSIVADGLNERLTIRRVRPVWSLAALLIIGIGLGLLLGSHVHQRLSPSQATKGNPVPSSPESIQRGMMLFSNNCTQCHGESGTGDGPLAKTLTLPPANLYDHIPYHSDQFFFGVMTNGFTGIMPAFGSLLSEDERWDILNYLRDRFGQPPPTQ
ncbi:MAG TPA: CopD family protein [Dehalococcoidia bacterium]|nr:CopD family protein [Dehalococcoidia bacterium]